jgi:tRNA pseudouridine55 synthase
MDGVLIIDKPEGPTSHDVVAAVRRALKESRLGHTGTLDPLATGVLPLAVGRATRLVRFLTASDKDYDATIRFGLATDTYDITGAELSRTDRAPSRDDVSRAVASLCGDYLQMPPAFSAKKVEGRRAYDQARRAAPVVLAPAPVRVSRAEVIDVSGAQARVSLTCSAGFYVRSFAHALGELTGTGACLETLRRTRSGDFTLDAALGLDAVQDRARVEAALVTLDRLLPGFPAVQVTPQGGQFVRHGRELEPGDFEPVAGSATRDGAAAPRDPAYVRLIDRNGTLLALGTAGRSPGSLHPAVVLV